jgi:hypothetical protein
VKSPRDAFTPKLRRSFSALARCNGRSQYAEASTWERCLTRRRSPSAAAVRPASTGCESRHRPTQSVAALEGTPPDSRISSPLHNSPSILPALSSSPRWRQQLATKEKEAGAERRDSGGQLAGHRSSRLIARPRRAASSDRRRCSDERLRFCVDPGKNSINCPVLFPSSSNIPPRLEICRAVAGFVLLLPVALLFGELHLYSRRRMRDRPAAAQVPPKNKKMATPNKRSPTGARRDRLVVAHTKQSVATMTATSP